MEVAAMIQTLNEFIPKFEDQFNRGITRIILNEQDYLEMKFACEQEFLHDVGKKEITFRGIPVGISPEVRPNHFAVESSVFSDCDAIIAVTQQMESLGFLNSL